MKTNTIKTTLAALTLGILAFTFTGCESTGRGSGSRTHEMGPPKSPSRMSDQSMPSR